MGRRVGVAAVLGAVFFALSCGSSSSNTGEIRFMQASPGQPLVDLVIDGAKQAYNLGYGNATGYLSVRAGSRHLQAIPTNSTTPLFDVSVPVPNSGDTTVFMTGSASAVKPLILTDGGTASIAEQSYVRVLNVSVNMGSAYVYIVSAGSSLAGTKPVATVGFDQDGGYAPVASGDYEVIMTKPGTQNVLLDTGPIYLAAAQNWTLVVLDGASGSYSFSLLQDQ